MYGYAIKLKFRAKGEIRKKLIDTVEWNDVYAPQCEGCREMYGDRTPPEKPPCYTCEPEFFEENAEAVKLFYLVKNQYIILESGPIDIMHEPIHSVMNLYEVRNKRECFEKILIMSASWLERLRDK